MSESKEGAFCRVPPQPGLRLARVATTAEPPVAQILPEIDREAFGPAWDEAFLRVESYLRAHQIESRIILNRLTVQIMHAARNAGGPNGEPPDGWSKTGALAGAVSRDPVALAMGEAERRTEVWFERVLGDAADPDDERLATRGRIALVMADVPARWPRHLFAEEPPPADLVEAMRAAYIEAGPELELTRMVPRPMDFGPIANVADEAWKTFKRWPVLRAVLGWCLFVALLAAIWFSSH